MRLEAEQIELRAGSFRLGPVSISVGDGEYLIILGPTGAGKTLTLEAIAGLRRIQSGRLMMDGRDVTAIEPEARRVGFLYQDSLLFPHLSVRANLAYGAHRLPRSERAAAVARLARLLEIEPLLARMPRGLSGGERHRVALGRALAGNPALLLLDEPMAALDPNSRQALRGTLRALHRELGTTTIHVTHNFPEALALGDRIAVLIDGKILQVGPPGDVFAHPQSAQIARFLRTASLATANEISDPGGAAATICLGAIAFEAASRANAEVPVLVAESAELGNGREPASAGDTVLARVVAVEAAGEALRVRLNVGLEVRASVPASGPGADSLAAGSSVWVRLPRTEIK
ncbi:MAG TPA: ATP-binding cassette domain-containing protein [Candidatus Binataceae bacterium]|nr:ATP-binding cassette domain-containing protein [Candidatus Binataceae bacterium]